MSRTVHERRMNPGGRRREPEPDVVTRLCLVRIYLDLLGFRNAGVDRMAAKAHTKPSRSRSTDACGGVM